MLDYEKGADARSNVTNFAKFTTVMAGSIALKQFLNNQEILDKLKK